MNLSVQILIQIEQSYCKSYNAKGICRGSKRTIKANGVEVLDPSLGGYPINVSNSSNKVLIASVIGVMIGLFVIF